jgi:hypothetical protein
MMILALIRAIIARSIETTAHGVRVTRIRAPLHGMMTPTGKRAGRPGEDAVPSIACDSDAGKKDSRPLSSDPVLVLLVHDA